MHDISVSVVVLTYNHENFILEALNSIESQDFSNIELIIGDDASSDDTRTLIEAFEKKSRLRFKKNFSKENVGITRNLNSCLSLCSGNIIFLLGGDDLFLPGKISAQVSHFLNDSSISISYHDVEVFDSDSNRTLYYYNDIHGRQEGGASVLVERGAFNCGSSVAIKNINLPMCDERIKYASDWLWYIEVLMGSGGEIKFLDGIYARYRRHENNVTGNSKLSQQYNEIMFSLDVVESKYSVLKQIAVKARSERTFAFSIKYMMTGEYRKSLRLFIMALRLNALSPLFFLRIRIRRVFQELRRFCLGG